MGNLPVTEMSRSLLPLLMPISFILIVGISMIGIVLGTSTGEWTISKRGLPMKPAQIKSCSFSSYSAATNEPFVLATTDVADADNEQVTTEELTLAVPTDSSSTANSDAAVTLHENKLVNRFLSNTSLSASEYGTDKTIKQTRSSEDEACCSVEILELGSGTGPEHEGSVAELTTSFFLARTDSTMTFAATLALLT